MACRRAPWGAACGLPPGAASIARRVGSKPGQVHLSCSPRVPQPLGLLSMLHVIPSRLFQTLNSQRWNCNVLRRSRKMTVGNYVRHYSVRSPALVCGVWCVVCGVWCWSGLSEVYGAGLVYLSCSPRVPQPPDPPSISHVIPSRLFQTLKSQRWDCNVLRRSRKMTVGNYVRRYSVRSGCFVAARAVPALARGARCGVRGARCLVCDSWAGSSTASALNCCATACVKM